MLQVSLFHPNLLTPNTWGKKINPVMSDEDFESLKLSIKENGIQIPLVCWIHNDKYIVVSGNNRLFIAHESGIEEVPVIIKEFKSVQAAKLFAIDDNVARRQLNTAQKAELALELQKVLAVGKGKRTDLLNHKEKVDAREEAAKRVGVSVASVSAMKRIIESGERDLIRSVRTGQFKLHFATKQLARRKNYPAPKPELIQSLKTMPDLGIELKPFYKDDLTILYHADCQDILKYFPSDALLLTDPPWGIKMKQGNRHSKAYGYIHGDDQEFNPQPFLKVFDNIVLWGANHFTDKLPQSDFWLLWDKLAGKAPKSKNSDAEMAWTIGSGRSSCRLFSHAWMGYHRDSEKGQEKIHPTQKPIALMKWCIEQFLQHDFPLVVDPYTGSGSTLLACRELGIPSIGIEIDEKYCQHIVNRITDNIKD